MPHPFQDSIVVFIGKPIRCTRQAAQDALFAVGGIIDENISTFVNYAVAFSGAENTKKYSKALKYKSFLAIINEEQFFDILEGRAGPPEKPESGNNVIYIPPIDPDKEAREQKQFMDDLINRKRIDNLAKHGIPMPDGGRLKVDFRSLDNVIRLTEFMKEKNATSVRDTPDTPDRCDNCNNPVKIFLGNGEGGVAAKLCQNCYNRMMAELTGVDIPDVIPERLSFKSKGGKTHDFEIEFLIFTTGKTLTATEIGKTKRKVDVDGELDADLNEMLETLKRRIKKALSTTYMEPSGYFADSKAVGYVEYNPERDAHDVIIDGKPYTWSELEKNISAHEGWKIKIEFGDVGDELD
jgi:hypothetical protein